MVVDSFLLPPPKLRCAPQRGPPLDGSCVVVARTPIPSWQTTLRRQGASHCLRLLLDPSTFVCRVPSGERAPRRFCSLTHFNMPPFLHRCLGCRRLWYTRTAQGVCPECGSSRREIYRVSRYCPERSSFREIVILGAIVGLAVSGLLVLA